MVHVIRPEERDCTTAQTSGMRREAAISGALTGAKGLWMGTGTNEPGGASGAHHHGESESGIYVLSGHIRFRFGANLEHVVDTEPGDFIFVPPWEIHSEENLSTTEPATFLLARNTQEPIVVNVEPGEQAPGERP